MQQDTTYNFPVVNIISSKIRQQTVGSINRNWSESDLDKLPVNNVAELFGEDAGIYIKSYGLGSLATSSIRGGSAGHTLVLWNGIPIQSPMLGLLDLALLPTSISENVSFTPGGNSALWGSGAIGGVLNLENQGNFSDKFNLQSNTQIGSFGQIQQQLKLGYGNEKWQFVTKLSHQKADNDFNYFVADGLPDRQQTNARLSQQMIGQDIYWKVDNRNNLSLHFWWQQSDRQIPPTNVQTRSEAHQDDLSTRVLLTYKHITTNGLWNIKTGFFDQHLDFFDEQILLESPSQVNTYLGEITRNWTWRNNHELLIGNTHTYTKAWAEGYRDNTPTEYKTALFASWKYNRERFNTQMSLRQEMVNGDLVPLIPSFGFNYNIINTIFLKGKFSRNYRLPTFNDRFWMPGGNPDLLPESGWSQELSLNYQWKNEFFLVETSITAFNRNIDNWILWSVQEGQSFFSANNVTKVWSRGLEPRIQVSRKFNNATIQLRSGYDYILSTNQVALERPKLAVGQQLIYTPVHHAFGTISVEAKDFYIAYQHDFTGSTNGINESLDPFQVGNLRLQYSGAIKKLKGILYFNINNLWDNDYLVVERRPMPGIHFETGINLIFNEKNNNIITTR